MTLHDAYGQIEHTIPLMEPVDIVSTATNTTHVKVTGHAVQFNIYFGTITGDSVTVTLEESTSAATTGAVAVGFNYRLSGSTTDTWSAVGTADSGGVVITASDDGKILKMEVKQSQLSDDCNYLSVLISPEASVSVLDVAAWAVQYPRFSKLDMLSAT